MNLDKLKNIFKLKKTTLRVVRGLIAAFNVVAFPGMLLQIIFDRANPSTSASAGVFGVLYFLSLFILIATFFNPTYLKHLFINYFLIFLVIANSVNPLSLDIIYDNKNSWGKPDENKNDLRDDIERFLINSKAIVGEGGQQILTNRASYLSALKRSRELTTMSKVTFSNAHHENQMCLEIFSKHMSLKEDEVSRFDTSWFKKMKMEIKALDKLSLNTWRKRSLYNTARGQLTSSPFDDSSKELYYYIKIDDFCNFTAQLSQAIRESYFEYNIKKYSRYREHTRKELEKFEAMNGKRYRERYEKMFFIAEVKDEKVFYNSLLNDRRRLQEEMRKNEKEEAVKCLRSTDLFLRCAKNENKVIKTFGKEMLSILMIEKAYRANKRILTLISEEFYNDEEFVKFVIQNKGENLLKDLVAFQSTEIFKKVQRSKLEENKKLLNLFKKNEKNFLQALKFEKNKDTVDYMIQKIPTELRNDKSLYQKVVKANPVSLYFLEYNPNVKDKFYLDIYSQNTKLFNYGFPSALFGIDSIVSERIAKNHDVYKKLPYKKKNNIDLIKSYLLYNPHVYNELDYHLQSNASVKKALIESWNREHLINKSFSSSSDLFILFNYFYNNKVSISKNEEELIIAKDVFSALRMQEVKFKNIQNIKEKRKEGRELISDLLAKNGWSDYIRKIIPFYENDLSLAIEISKSNYSDLLSQFKDIVLNNEELAVASVLTSPYNFNYLSDTMKNSVAFAGKIAKRSGYAYLNLGSKVKKKREHVLIALRGLDRDRLNGNKLKYFLVIEEGVPENLRNDIEIIKVLGSLNKGLLTLANRSAIKKTFPKENMSTLLNESFSELISIASSQGVRYPSRLFLKLPDFIVQDKKKSLKVMKEYPFYYVQLVDKLKKDTEIFKQSLDSWTKIDYSELRLFVFNNISNRYGRQSLLNFSLTPFDGVDSSLITSVEDCVKVLKVTPLSYINIPEKFKKDPQVRKYKELFEDARKLSNSRHEVFR